MNRGLAADPSARLRQLADEILLISANLERSRSGSGDDVATAHRPADRAVIARTLYTVRRRREEIFGNGEIFGEPAWDILLDLFIAEQDRKALPVTSACIGAAVPTTTGLRWLNILEKQGLVERSNDPGDARRTFVRLSAKGLRAMNRFIDQFATMLD